MPERTRTKRNCPGDKIEKMATIVNVAAAQMSRANTYHDDFLRKKEKRLWDLEDAICVSNRDVFS